MKRVVQKDTYLITLEDAQGVASVTRLTPKAKGTEVETQYSFFLDHYSCAVAVLFAGYTMLDCLVTQEDGPEEARELVTSVRAAFDKYYSTLD
jgi:hypothetical protein